MERKSRAGRRPLNREAAQRVIRILEYFRSFGFEHLPIRGAAGCLAFPGTASETRGPGLAQLPAEPQRGDSPASVPVTAPLSQETTKQERLKALREDIGDCRRCKLHGGRTHIVFGEGSVDARIMFVGEGPGREEDLQGRPFVGDAGQLLTRLVERMGLRRADVYIANVVKCRPPMNRDPQEDEISSCIPFLRSQIEIIGPEVIVSLGRISAHTLLGSTAPMSRFSITKVRGTFSEYVIGGRAIPLMPTFHPAYLLRNPKDKWATWDDAQAVLRRIGVPGGDEGQAGSDRNQ